MSKVIVALLVMAAFIYAVWLVLFRKKLPDPKSTSGLKRRFLIATVLFAALLGTQSCIHCYQIAKIENYQLHRQDIIDTLQAVWWTLCLECEPQFREKLDELVEAGYVNRKPADMLRAAFSELAMHKKRKQMSCYITTPLNMRMEKIRETALRRVEMLSKAYLAGTLDEETTQRAKAALAQELEVFYGKGFDQQSGKFNYDENVIQQYESETITPCYEAMTAAEIIVQTETDQRNISLRSKSNIEQTINNCIKHPLNDK